MSIQSNSKKRMAAAVAVLGVSGAGLIAGLGGDGAHRFTAGMPVDRPSEVTATWLPDAANDARVGLVARRIGWSRYALERALASGSVSSDAAPDFAGGSSPPAHRPRTITVTLPSYEGGRPPSMTAPALDAGERPTVEPGWTSTVDLGELPSASAPSVDPGESGTIEPPSVDVA